MENLRTLRTWLEEPPQMIAVSSIRTDDAMQPRSDRLVPLRDKYRVTKMSDEHVTRLLAALQGGKDVQMEPLLVADVGGERFVVDGHHRLKAYKRAKRSDVPVRILRLSKKDAAMLSKLVNATGTKIPMTRDQAAEACWQTVADITLRGRIQLGMSLREIGGLFGIGKDTVAAMLHNLKAVKLSEFGPSACDPATGWPLWKYVKQTKFRPQVEASSVEQRLAMQAEKDAAKLAAFRDKLGPTRFAAAIQLLLKEARAADGQDQWADLRQWDALLDPVIY